jgi:hypothetical protein
MRYKIVFYFDRKRYQYLVEHQPVDKVKEQFLLITKSKTLTIDSNRPLFRNKGLKHRRYDLKLVGDYHLRHSGFMKVVYEQIEELVSKYLEKNEGVV